MNEPQTCPQCRSNDISVNAGVLLTSDPPQQQYRCDACGHRWSQMTGPWRTTGWTKVNAQPDTEG